MHLSYIGTHDVQCVEVVQVDNHGSICITCFLAEGSMAQGCLCRLHSVNGLVIASAIIQRSSQETAISECITVSVGIYRVSIFDVESDGEYDLTNEAIMMSFEVMLQSTTLRTTHLGTASLHK